MTLPERETFLDWAGLVATGKVQSYNGAVCLLVGPPGSGKGGILKLLKHALGRLYFTGKAELFGGNRPSGHDNDLAVLLLQRPLIVGLDERGAGNSKVSIDKFNSWTGDTEQGPVTRKGDPTPITGTPRFAIIHAAVNAPDLPRGTGIERRLCAIATHKAIDEANRNAEELPDYLADALVTLMCLRAWKWNSDEPAGVKGTEAAQAQVFEAMDPLTAEVKHILNEEPDYWNDRLLKDLLQVLKADWPKLSARYLQTKVVAAGWKVGPQRGKGELRGRPLIAP